jgi:hypothetical protein
MIVSPAYNCRDPAVNVITVAVVDDATLCDIDRVMGKGSASPVTSVLVGVEPVAMTV